MIRNPTPEEIVQLKAFVDELLAIPLGAGNELNTIILPKVAEKYQTNQERIATLWLFTKALVAKDPPEINEDITPWDGVLMSAVEYFKINPNEFRQEEITDEEYQNSFDVEEAPRRFMEKKRLAGPDGELYVKPDKEIV